MMTNGLEGQSLKYFTIPRAILPKPLLCDQVTAMKSVYDKITGNCWFAVSLSRSVDFVRHFDLGMCFLPFVEPSRRSPHGVVSRFLRPNRHLS